MLQTPIRKRKANEVLRAKLLGSQQVSPKEEGAYAAARKCFQAVPSRRKELEREVPQLRSAVVHLKDEILKHAQCGDEAINDYLARMLKQVSGRSMLRLSSLDQTKESLASEIFAISTPRILGLSRFDHPSEHAKGKFENIIEEGQRQSIDAILVISQLPCQLMDSRMVECFLGWLSPFQ
jgi:hypothetical protein